MPANRWRRDKTPPELITGSDLFPCPIQRNVLVPRREKRLLRFSFPRSLPSSFFTAVFLIDRGEEEGETHIAIHRKCAGGGQFPIQTFFFADGGRVGTVPAIQTLHGMSVKSPYTSNTVQPAVITARSTPRHIPNSKELEPKRFSSQLPYCKLLFFCSFSFRLDFSLLWLPALTRRCENVAPTQTP